MLDHLSLFYPCFSCRQTSIAGKSTSNSDHLNDAVSSESFSVPAAVNQIEVASDIRNDPIQAVDVSCLRPSLSQSLIIA